MRLGGMSPRTAVPPRRRELPNLGLSLYGVRPQRDAPVETGQARVDVVEGLSTMSDDSDRWTAVLLAAAFVAVMVVAAVGYIEIFGGGL
jgi:hypothetical protein